MGTKITYKSLGHSPEEDYKNVIKKLNRENKVISKRKELDEIIRDPNTFLLQLGKKDLYSVNKLKYKNESFLMREGNPVTYYYSIAYDTLPQLDNFRLSLLDNIKGEKSNYQKLIEICFSNVFKCSTIIVTFSFLALEAFINQCIPDNIKIQHGKKIIDKVNIQRYKSFNEKFEYIIPSITKKNFKEAHPKRFATILEIKRLRDDIIHLKENRTQSLVAYEEIYNHLLNIDSKKLINTVKFYINYHKKGTITNYSNKELVKILSRELGEDSKGKFIKYYYK